MESQLWSWEWADSQQSVLSVHIYGPLNWEEYRNAWQVITHVISGVPHKVDVIYVFETEVSPLPPGGATRHFRETLLEAQPHNKRMCVLVNAPTLLASTLQLSITAMGAGDVIRLMFANTPDDAQRIIRRRGQAASGQS